MKFNPLQRGKKREANTEDRLYEVLDSGFVCTIAVNVDGQPMMILTSYGRDGEYLYLHGSIKNHILLEALKADSVCISVHHTDGIVLAQTLFNTSINYRSVVMFGNVTLVDNEEERLHGLECVTENIIPGRWSEVKTGTPEQLKATLVVKFLIESATVKIREVGPQGDEDLNEDVWSGVLPLKTVALPPVFDAKRLQQFDEDDSVELFYLKNKFQ